MKISNCPAPVCARCAHQHVGNPRLKCHVRDKSAFTVGATVPIEEETHLPHPRPPSRSPAHVLEARHLDYPACLLCISTPLLCTRADGRPSAASHAFPHARSGRTLITQVPAPIVFSVPTTLALASCLASCECHHAWRRPCCLAVCQPPVSSVPDSCCQRTHYAVRRSPAPLAAEAHGILLSHIGTDLLATVSPFDNIVESPLRLDPPCILPQPLTLIPLL